MKEHKIVVCNMTNENTRKASEGELNALGMDGWEVISVNTISSEPNCLFYSLERFRKE